MVPLFTIAGGGVVGSSERATFDFTSLLEASGLLDHHQ
jgi:hypothetical protein